MANNPEPWTIIIPDYWPPSLNHTQMAHWRKVRKHKETAKDMVLIHAKDQNGELPEFSGPVTVKLTRIYGGRKKPMDLDNLYGSVKPLCDALRASKLAGGRRGVSNQGGLGIIQDDDPRTMQLEVEQRPSQDGEPDLAAQITVIGERSR